MEDGKITIAFGLKDNSISVWELSIINSFAMEEIQRIRTRPHFTLAISIYRLIGNRAIMAIGGSDSKVHIYHSFGKSLFQLCFTLDGHDNWIRSLSLILISSSVMLVASASQDKYIRIWKLDLNPLPKTAEINSIIQLKTLLWNSPSLDHSLEIRLTSVLLGHDDWVYSCRWVGSLVNDDMNGKDPILPIPFLLSSSSDGSIILWQPHGDTWISIVKFY